MSERYQRGEIVNVALQDARLIAAAPEMYEALRELLAHHRLEAHRLMPEECVTERNARALLDRIGGGV